MQRKMGVCIVSIEKRADVYSSSLCVGSSLSTVDEDILFGEQIQTVFFHLSFYFFLKFFLSFLKSQ